MSQDPQQPVNPYASPDETAPGVQDTDWHEIIGACPRCRSEEISPAPYNPATGRAGPRAIDHLRCHQCGAQFNGETGQPIGHRISNYLIPAFGLGCAVLYFLLIIFFTVFVR